MKLKDVITEKLNSFVYVKETLQKLTDILTNNKLVLDEYMADKKKYYVLNTSSSRKSLIDSEKIVSIIQLNGDRLNASIKTKNVEYYLNSKNKGVGDKLYSDEKIIDDAVHYIEQVSILIDDKMIIPEKALKNIEALCKDQHIPLFFFNNKQDFINNSRNKTIKLPNPDYNYKKKDYTEIPETVKALFYYSKHDDLSAIPEKFGIYLKYLTIDQQKANFVNRIKQDIKSMPQNELSSKAFKELFDREGTEDIGVIVSKLSKKWKEALSKKHAK